MRIAVSIFYFLFCKTNLWSAPDVYLVNDDIGSFDLPFLYRKSKDERKNSAPEKLSIFVPVYNLSRDEVQAKGIFATHPIFWLISTFSH